MICRHTISGYSSGLRVRKLESSDRSTLTLSHLPFWYLSFLFYKVGGAFPASCVSQRYCKISKLTHLESLHQSSC